MEDTDISKVVSVLKKEIKRFKVPAVTVVSERTRDPFRVLISCLLSLRTKDEVTAAASARLFDLASTPKETAALTTGVIEKAIYPAGFYRTKARIIKDISRELAEEHGSKVPDTIEGLLKLKGVGRKTANLVVTLGFGKPGICVDTHVHRITNRWGYVKTKNPEETETALREKLPKRHWIPINDLLVTYGQNLCKPVSPHCSECRLFEFCERKGVIKSR
ncbi:MAG: endonuclease III [Thermodesulfobacteriota bacterium]